MGCLSPHPLKCEGLHTLAETVNARGRANKCWVIHRHITGPRNWLHHAHLLNVWLGTVILGACRKLLLLMDAGCTATGLRFHALFMKVIKTRSREMKYKHDQRRGLSSIHYWRGQFTQGELSQEYIYRLQEIELRCTNRIDPLGFGHSGLISVVATLERQLKHLPIFMRDDLRRQK